MTTQFLCEEDRQILLKLARECIASYARGEEVIELDLARYPRQLIAPGATFVTLTVDGALRGCIGTLEARLPLVEDVCEHAVAAARDDYRFPPVRVDELDRLSIEISYLSEPCPLAYQNAEQLVGLLRPGIDGVVLIYRGMHATFLPQVWEKLPRPDDFLAHLCQKMGAPADLWKTTPLLVFTYQVEEFSE